jgi:hypothetical protein
MKKMASRIDTETETESELGLLSGKKELGG